MSWVPSPMRSFPCCSTRARAPRQRCHTRELARREPNTSGGSALEASLRFMHSPTLLRNGAGSGNYVTTVTQRDVPEISRVRLVAELPKLLRMLAARTGQELNIARLAGEVAIDRNALARNYLPILETVYLIRMLPAWSRSVAKRIIRHPKVHIMDSGLAAHLVGADEAVLSEPTSTVTGSLVETFVVAELIRQLAIYDELGVSISHSRANDGPEVDVVLEMPDGRVAAVEAKATATVRASDVRHLAAFRDRIDKAGGTFTHGVVLHCGDQVIAYGDRVSALPLAALWTPMRRGARD